MSHFPNADVRNQGTDVVTSIPIKQLKAINAMRRNEYHVAFL
jgi:hypothetical protein